MVLIKAMIRTILSIALTSMLAVSPLRADIKNTKAYVADLYNAKKNDGWSCYFWLSDAEDQAIKAGKACGETEAALYCQAAEYAEELQDESTAKSLKQAYANGQLTMGPLGLTAACIFMGCCAKYIDHKLGEADRLWRENLGLEYDIANLKYRKAQKDYDNPGDDYYNKKKSNYGSGYGSDSSKSKGSSYGKSSSGKQSSDQSFDDWWRDFQKQNGGSGSSNKNGSDSDHGSSNNGGTSWQTKTKRQQALDDLNDAIRDVNGKSGPTDLKVSELTSASAKGDIQKAFRQLSKHYHPDKFPNDPAARAKAEDTFKKLGNARDELVGNTTSSAQW